MSRWEPLLAVQEHDTHADQLAHRLRGLPLRGEVVAHEGKVAALAAQAAEVESRKGELTRSSSRLDDEIASQNERADQTEKRLYAGTVSNPRELQALQDDVASIRRRVGQLEDEQLEIMELSEPVDARLAELATARAELDAEGDRLRTALADTIAGIEAELADVQAKRAAAAEQVDPGLWPEYDKLRRQLGGMAVARLVGATCQGCRLALPSVELDRIKRLPLDEPVHCEECGRLLVRD